MSEQEKSKSNRRGGTVWNQSEFDSLNGLTFYSSAEEAPKEASSYLHILEKYKKDKEETE